MRKIVLLGLLMSLTTVGMASTAGQIATVDPAHRTLPVYPPAAYHARYDCSVVVAAVIHEDGTVGDVEVMGATQPKLGFEEATVDAIKQWRFEPARQNGEAVRSVAAFQLDYRRIPGSGGGAYVAGDHLVSTFTPSIVPGEINQMSNYSPGADMRLDTPGQILKRNGFAPTLKLSSGIQTIDIPPEARKCEMCVYSREGIIPPQRLRRRR